MLQIMQGPLLNVLHLLSSQSPMLLIRKLGLPLVAVSLLSAVASAQTYTITDLGTLPRGTSSGAYGINSFGQVVGQSSDGQSYTLQSCIDCYTRGTVCRHDSHHCDKGNVDEQHGFLWTPTITNGTNGSLTDLGTLGGPNSIAVAISPSGQLIGRADIDAKVLYQEPIGDDGCC